MANPLFQALGGAATGGLNPIAMLAQFRQNPMAMIQRAGLNVPANITDPNAIIQHLMNSGQISQAQYDRARQMAGQFGIR